MRRWAALARGRDSRGMALLITIMVVSLLIAVTVQFSRSVRQSFFSSATQLDGENLLAIARSGLRIGAAVLEADGTNYRYDSLLDAWNVTGPDQFGDLFPERALQLQFADLSGRLQINSLVGARDGGEAGESELKSNETREVLKQLFVSGTFGKVDEAEARALVDGLVDWLDPDDDESEFGAESGYYQALTPPYGCRNGPVRDLSELLLVKGMTPRLLYGGDGLPGLADLLTVHGSDGKVNINTAPVELLRGLHPLMNSELAQILDNFRRDDANIELLAESDWYRRVPAFPGDIVLPGRMLSVTSSFFQIRSEGHRHQQRRLLTAVIERQKDNSTVIVERRLE